VPACGSGFGVVVERRRVTDRYEQSLGTEEPSGDLAPRFSSSVVDESVALGLEFARSGSDVCDFELDAGLWDRDVLRRRSRS
jgi:hypothetical protein